MTLAYNHILTVSLTANGNCPWETVWVYQITFTDGCVNLPGLSLVTPQGYPVTYWIRYVLFCQFHSVWRWFYVLLISIEGLITISSLCLWLLQATFQIHSHKRAEVNHMVTVGDGVWISLKYDSTLRLFHATNFTHMQDLDIAPSVRRVLGEGSSFGSCSHVKRLQFTLVIP